MIDAVVAGHLCLDIIPQIPPSADADQLLAPGRLTEVGAAVLSTGGAVSNTGLALVRLGMAVRLVARIGDDSLGAMTRDIVERHGAGLGRDLRASAGEPSSYTLVLSPPGRDRSFLHCPGTNNTFSASDVSPDLLAAARLFHLGYPPLLRRMYADGGEELAGLFRTASDAGATTSLDLSLPDPAQPSGQADWARILRLTLPWVDLFQPSVEELLFMLDRPRYDRLRARRPAGGIVGALEASEVSNLAARALDLGARAIALKVGERGLYLRTSHRAVRGRGAPEGAEWCRRELWAPCFRVDVVSTVGSGDATIAGFLAALLRGQSPTEAITTAVGVGACNVEAPDATSGVRTWAETQARITAAWPRLDARVGGGGWTWDAGAGVWRGPHDEPGP